MKKAFSRLKHFPPECFKIEMEQKIQDPDELTLYKISWRRQRRPPRHVYFRVQHFSLHSHEIVAFFVKKKNCPCENRSNIVRLAIPFALYKLNILLF